MNSVILDLTGTRKLTSQEEFQKYLDSIAAQQSGTPDSTTPQAETPDSTTPSIAESSSFEGDSRFIEANNYGLALQELRATLPQGNAFHPLVSGLPRPLTIKETLLSCIENFNTSHNPDGTERSLKDRKRLFLDYFDTCTGIHYNPNTDKFIIIPCCDRLITLDSSFSEEFVNVPYGTLPGVELDRTKSKYGSFLTKQEVLQHKGWLALFENDAVLLKEYADLVFSLNKGNLMAFWLKPKTNVTSPELRAVCVYSLSNSSPAFGSYDLSSNACFLLKSPSSSQKFLGGAK
jgi:hypothetical protein